MKIGQEISFDSRGKSTESQKSRVFQIFLVIEQENGFQPHILKILEKERLCVFKSHPIQGSLQCLFKENRISGQATQGEERKEDFGKSLESGLRLPCHIHINCTNGLWSRPTNPQALALQL